MRTQVAIIGAGCTGLWLSHLLHLQGITSVVLERRSQRQVESGFEAGLLDHTTMNLLNHHGIGQHIRKEGLVHTGLDIVLDGAYHTIESLELTGETLVTYTQGALKKDLIAACLAAQGALLFDVDNVNLHALESDYPIVRYTHEGQKHQLQAEFVVGCDGLHGVCRPSMLHIPSQDFSRVYPFAWLSLLIETPPMLENRVVYSRHSRGFAMVGVGMEGVQHVHLQCDPSDDVSQWSDDRLWAELNTRLGNDRGWTLPQGAIIQKKIVGIRSFEATPMKSGRLFLAGDAARVVPPIASKGLNMAVSDACLLSRYLTDFFTHRKISALDHYGEQASQSVWRSKYFSLWMTNVFHRFPDATPFQEKLQRAQLDYVVSSRAAATVVAENYVGRVNN